MLHQSRVWGISASNGDELVQKLQEYSWTLCSAFQTSAGTIWANDSTSEDAVQEYAVLRPLKDGQLLQVESITVGWCNATELKSLVEMFDRGEQGESWNYGRYPSNLFEANHQPCSLCR